MDNKDSDFPVHLAKGEHPPHPRLFGDVLLVSLSAACMGVPASAVLS